MGRRALQEGEGGEGMICDKELTFPLWEESDNDSCVVDYCLRIMDAARKESCGMYVLCREGTSQAYEIIKDISQGCGKSDDIELLYELLEQIIKHEKCKVANSASTKCLELLSTYEDEWIKHIRRKICTNMVCKEMYTLYIDPNLCDGCGLCINSCAFNAILGGEQMIHVIDIELCNKALECMKICPKQAIKKAGNIKPRIPKEPVPVGSFKGSSDEPDGHVTRRRRRRK